MLDEGVKLAFPGARTACFVEWEAYAQACLLARMEEQSLEPAPIWGDSLQSFPADQFAGRVDWIASGFPCQPHSLAGKRQGVADERWIWEAIADIIRRVGPRFVFLENVRGLLSSSAGSAFGTVLRDLARLGFDVEWTVLRASEVGASHQRARLFILAHRKGERLGEARLDYAKQPGRTGGSSPALAHCESKRRSQGRAESSRIERRPDASQRRSPMANAGNGFVSEPGRQSQSGTGIGSAGANLVGESNRERQQQSNNEAGSIPRREPWGSIGGASELMADTGSAGCQGSELGGACESERHGTNAPGSVAEFCGPHLFAPGPQSELWRSILAERPWLAPAISEAEAQSFLCGISDGLAVRLDATRADALRCAGNGVIPLQAALAFAILAGRLAIKKVARHVDNPLGV